MFASQAKKITQLSVLKSKEKSIGIYGLFWTALAISKFQRYESEKYKNSIEYKFDKETAVDELKILFNKNRQFFLTQYLKLSYYIRKFHLSFSDLESISTLLSPSIYKHLNDVQTSFDQNHLKYFLCLCLNYLVQNSIEIPEFFQFEQIMKMIKDYTCFSIKTELVLLMAYVIEKSNDSVLINQLSSELNTLVFDMVELNQDVKELFLSKLELHKKINFDSETRQKKEKRMTLKIKTVKSNQQVVTRTIQTVKLKTNNKKSEENQFKLMNLSKTIKSRNRNFNSKTTLEPLDTANDRKGNDQSIFNNTWKEAINLYSIALNKKLLKATDKDDYVPSKLLGNHYFFDAYGGDSRFLYSFFSNRIFAAILLIVSRSQKLNDYAIDTLMKCFTNFEKFYVTLLYRHPNLHTNKSQYVEKFIDAVFDRYWDLKKLQTPQLIVDFCRKMADLIVEEYISYGWAYNSTEKRKKNFNREHVEEVVNNEILQVRLDAVTAVYNSAVRDKKILTSKRLKIFENFLRKEDVYDAKFQEFVIKIIDLADSSNEIDVKQIFHIYIDKLVPEKLEKNIKIILNFINNQVKDYNRCREMFNDRVIKTLLSFLSNRSVYNLEIKQDILEIVNNYLEHELIKGLSDENLNLLIDNTTFSNFESSLTSSAFNSLLLIVEKPDSALPLSVLSKLMKNFELNENSNYVLLILSRAIIDNKNGLYLSNSDHLEQISCKLGCDEVINLNGDDKKIKFEKRSNGNRHDSSNFISLMTANIIMKSIEKKIKLSAKTIDNIILCLYSTNEDDKQTKIIAAKCLYRIDKYMSVDNLNVLNELVNSDIYDVSVYVQSVYLHGCVRVAYSTEKKLEPVHLENISSFYADQTLKIGINDYANDINQYFFQILLYEARKQKLNDENLFDLFEYLLMLNQNHVTQIIEILIVYTGNYTIPMSTIRALENTLGIPQYFKRVFLIMQNVISFGQMVSNKTVFVLVDNIFNSINSRLKYFSFKLLEKVIQNQHVSDDVFDKYELTKAGFALHKPNLNDEEKFSIIKVIQFKTENGVQLPGDTKLELEKHLHFDGVLKIFYYMSKNKHILSQHLLNLLIDKFNPDKDNEEMICLTNIFENMAKNNQTLPRQLVSKLEMALESNSNLKNDVISVFVHLAQKGELLSKNVINKILDRLLEENSVVIKQELLSSLGSLIEANKTQIYFCKNKIQTILIKHLDMDSFNIYKICIKIIHVFAHISKIDDNLVEKLVQIGTNSNCNKSIKREIFDLFNTYDKNEKFLLTDKQIYLRKIQLANLSYTSNHELLDVLNTYVDFDDGFLDQNYKQLKDLIDSEMNINLQAKALNLLIESKTKDKISDELLESVALLYESTVSDYIHKACLNLLNKLNQSGKGLGQRAKLILNQTLVREKNLRKLFQNPVYDDLKNVFNLDDWMIRRLFDSVIFKDTELIVDNLEAFMELVISENQFYYDNPIIVLIIEKSLSLNKLTEIALPCYRQIIKNNKAQSVKNILETLSLTSLDDEISLDLLHAIYAAIQANIHLADVCIQVLEKILYESEGIERSVSFKALFMIQKQSNYSDILLNSFVLWCQQSFETLSQQCGVKIQDMNILEIVLSIEYINLDIFKKKPKKIWQRELLVSNIFENFQTNISDQMDFYSNWLMVEKKFNMSESIKILTLLEPNLFDSFNQINESISIILEFDSYQNIINLLNVDNISIYLSLKQEWFVNMIKNYIGNQCMNINKIYLSTLVEKLSYKLEYSFFKKLLSCILKIDNLREFEILIDFCVTEKVRNYDLNFDKVNLKDLKLLLEVKCLSKSIKAGDQESFLTNILTSLLNKDWTFEKLKILVNLNLKSKHIIDFLNTINQYNLSSFSNFHKCKKILFESKTFIESMRKLNILAIENNFQLEGKVKDTSELLAEFKSGYNLTNKNIIKYVDTDLRTHLELVKSETLKSEIYTQTVQPIAQWNEKQISQWSKEKSKTKNVKDYEAIAVIKQANFIQTGHTLTDTQVLCSLIALNNANQMLKGKLLEVATGEGKSTIVCILAIINALKGFKVDVITSSPVLAERDAKQKAKLFRMFNLTCSDNNDKSVYLKGIKDCYKADIVYGEVSQFEFDILRDNYSKLETLGTRKCEIAIVDEVDSMLIDDSSKIARLSTTVAGMDHFHAIYVFIWQRLVSIQQNFFTFNKKTYFIEGKIQFENDKITLRYVDSDDDNNLKKVENLEQLLLNCSDDQLISIGVEYVGDDIEEYLKRSLERFIDIQIEESNVMIAQNFVEFFKKQKPKWISNAIEALNYQENVHYIVQNGQIKPVDYYSTGIVQSSTNWSDGLHQFLQLKHNLKMTSETLTTNFLSNIGFINKYKQVFGLTGTLGSETARNVLKSVYKVELINVPQRRQKQFIEFEPIIALNDQKWLNEIILNVKLEAEVKNRGVLVICETIEHANRISDSLKTKMRPSAVKVYTMNNMDQERNVEKIHPGEVIIATNLAGRGTDIHTSEIEQYGGLHVILSFMPSNQRVQDQAFGRTARQGKRGTGLMILNSINLPSGLTNTKQVKQIRNQAESKMLNEFEKNQLKLIIIKDDLFAKFCQFLNEIIRKDIREKHGGWYKNSASIYETNILAAIEEQWAMFLRKLDDGEIRPDDSEAKYSQLIKQLKFDYENDSVIKNLYYYVNIGFDILKEGSLRDTSRAKEAIEYFKKAVHSKTESNQKSGFFSSIKSKAKSLIKPINNISEEKQFEFGSAYLGIAWCLLLIQQDNYKEESLDAFKIALLSISKEMSILNSIQIILEQKNPYFVNSDLYKQLNVKASILGSYLNSIQNCIDGIKRSLRLIDLEIKELKSECDLIEQINEQQKSSDIKSILKKNALHAVSFNSMTIRTDNGERDQAIQTLENSFIKSCIKDCSYDKICVKLKQVDAERVKSALFDVNKEFKDLTKESVISKLKEERSLFNFMRLTSSFQVDLNIYSIKGDLNENLKNRQINDLINLIEEKTDNNLRFNINIKSSNDNVIEPENNFKINLDLDNLDNQNLLLKLDSVKADFVNIETSMNKAGLKKLIEDNPKIESAIVCAGVDDDNDKKVYLRLSRNKLKQHLAKLENDYTSCYIKFESLNIEDAKNLVKNCQKNHQLLYSVKFLGLQKSSLEIFDGQLNLYFDYLTIDTAKTIIPLIRKANFEFCLEFKELSKDQVEHLILNSSLDQEKVEINKVKNLSELFLKNSMPTLELSEFRVKGIDDVIEISEKAFVPWRSVITVAILGASQVILGSVLVCTGFGSSAGMAFITEGLADMFTAYRAYSTRQFTWTDYCKQKAISLAISAVSLGFSKLNDAAKGAKTMVTEAGKEISQEVARELAEKTTSKFVLNSSNFAGTITKTGTNLKSLVFKYVGVKTGEAVVTESLNAGVKILSNFAFDHFKPQISENIQLKTQSAFINNHELISILRKMHAIDLATNSNQLQTRVEQIVQEVINPSNSFAMKQWNSIGLPLLKGVLSSSENYGSSISIAFRIIGTLNGLREIAILLNSVVDILVVKLRTADQNSMTINMVLYRSLKIDKRKAMAIANKLKDMRILNEYDNLNIPSANLDFKCSNLEKRIKDFEAQKKDILKNLDGMSDEEFNKSVEFINKFYQMFNSIDLDSLSMIIKCVALKITDQLIQVADSSLVQPWATLATSKLTDEFSKRVQKEYLVNKNQNSHSHDKDQMKYDDLKDKKEPLTDDEKKFIRHYEAFQTIGEQINDNARDYCIAYCQFEMDHYSRKTNASIENDKTKPVDEHVKKISDNVRNGGPASLAEMRAAATKYNINLIIVDDKNKVDLDNIPKGAEVVYFESRENNEIGHVEYFDKNSGEFVDPQSSGYDCFYTALSNLLDNYEIKKNPSEIREETADHIEANSENFSKAVEAQIWIEDRCTNQANILLFNAGRKNKKNGKKKINKKNGKKNQPKQKISAKNNLEDQSPGIKALITLSLGRMPNNLTDVLTNDFKRNNPGDDGYHLMKEGTLLEGYFTSDLKCNIKNQQLPGNARLLFKHKFNKNNKIAEVKLFGVVDTHGDNVKEWKQINESEQKNYFQVKNAKGTYVGVKKVNTN